MKIFIDLSTEPNIWEIKMKENRVLMEFENSDTPEQAAAAKLQREQFDRNSAWLQANFSEINDSHRGKTICIAGQQLFVGDTTREAVAKAKAVTRRIRAGSHGTSPRKRRQGSMLCEGEWLLCEDGLARPIMRARIFGKEAAWLSIQFLLDTGADRTVIARTCWISSVFHAFNLRIESEELAESWPPLTLRRKFA